MRISNVPNTRNNVIVGDHVGWIVRYRNATVLITSRGQVVVDESDECRPALTGEQARKRLAELATAGSGASADEMTMREIGAALRMSQRILRQIIARGTGAINRVDSPEEFLSHDYIGSFTVGDELVVADRCYIDQTRPLLACSTKAEPGRWHAYIRHGSGEDISAAMFAVHDDHLDDARGDGEDLGAFGVDSGSAVIVDARARKRAAWFVNGDQPWVEGIVEDLGCFAFTACGDGVYPVRAHRKNGRAVVVRASLEGAEHAYYQPPRPSKEPPSQAWSDRVTKQIAQPGDARVYSPKTRFAVGERMKHPKFGDGIVSALLPDKKCTIDFPDGPRTLVHDR